MRLLSCGPPPSLLPLEGSSSLEDQYSCSDLISASDFRFLLDVFCRNDVDLLLEESLSSGDLDSSVGGVTSP